MRLSSMVKGKRWVVISDFFSQSAACLILIGMRECLNANMDRLEAVSGSRRSMVTWHCDYLEEHGRVRCETDKPQTTEENVCKSIHRAMVWNCCKENLLQYENISRHHSPTFWVATAWGKDRMIVSVIGSSPSTGLKWPHVHHHGMGNAEFR